MVKSRSSKDFLGGLDKEPSSVVKNLSAMWETWVGKDPWRRKWQPTPVLLPGEFPRTEEPGGLQSTGLQIRHN